MPAKEVEKPTKTVKPKFKIPKTKGALVDRLYEVKQQRLALQRQVAAIQEEETALAEAVINTLPSSDLTGIVGKVGKATVVVGETYQVENWDALYKYVVKNKAFELLQRKLSTKAIEERIESGNKIPGVKKFKYKKVSISKV